MEEARLCAGEDQQQQANAALKKDGVSAGLNWAAALNTEASREPKPAISLLSFLRPGCANLAAPQSSAAGTTPFHPHNQHQQSCQQRWDPCNSTDQPHDGERGLKRQQPDLYHSDQQNVLLGPSSVPVHASTLGMSSEHQQTVCGATSSGSACNAGPATPEWLGTSGNEVSGNHTTESSHAGHQQGTYLQQGNSQQHQQLGTRSHPVSYNQTGLQRGQNSNGSNVMQQAVDADRPEPAAAQVNGSHIRVNSWQQQHLNQAGNRADWTPARAAEQQQQHSHKVGASGPQEQAVKQTCQNSGKQRDSSKVCGNINEPRAHPGRYQQANLGHHGYHHQHPLHHGAQHQTAPESLQQQHGQQPKQVAGQRRDHRQLQNQHQMADAIQHNRHGQQHNQIAHQGQQLCHGQQYNQSADQIQHHHHGPQDSNTTQHRQQHHHGSQDSNTTQHRQQHHKKRHQQHDQMRHQDWCAAAPVHSDNHNQQRNPSTHLQQCVSHASHIHQDNISAHQQQFAGLGSHHSPPADQNYADTQYSMSHAMRPAPQGRTTDHAPAGGDAQQQEIQQHPHNSLQVSVIRPPAQWRDGQMGPTQQAQLHHVTADSGDVGLARQDPWQSHQSFGQPQQEAVQQYRCGSPNLEAVQQYRCGSPNLEDVQQYRSGSPPQGPQEPPQQCTWGNGVQPQQGDTQQYNSGQPQQKPSQQYGCDQHKPLWQHSRDLAPHRPLQQYSYDQPQQHNCGTIQGLQQQYSNGQSQHGAQNQHNSDQPQQERHQQQHNHGESTNRHPQQNSSAQPQQGAPQSYIPIVERLRLQRQQSLPGQPSSRPVRPAPRLSVSGLARQLDTNPNSGDPNRSAAVPAPKAPRIPKCPYKSCPGVYATCGAQLRWCTIHEGFWGCSTFPDCEFRYYPHMVLHDPHLSVEVLSEKYFKVTPQPGAEFAVEDNGGVATILGRLGLDPKLIVDIANTDLTEVALQAAREEDAVVFQLEHYERIIGVIDRKPGLMQKGAYAPQAVLRAYRGQYAPRLAPDKVEEYMQKVPAALRNALMPFQQEGVRFVLERHGRCLIADEMGVGKTVQAIALASCYMDEWPLLVIVPASLRLVWAEEMERWLPHLRPSRVHVIEGKEQRLTGASEKELPAVTITSFEMMKRLTCDACKAGRHNASQVVLNMPRKGQDEQQSAQKAVCAGIGSCMAALPCGVVIVDESHNLRTTGGRMHDSPHTEACVSALSRARRAILLSGTPSLTRPYDLYRQIDVLRPGLLGPNKEAFSHRYCDRRLVPTFRWNGTTNMRWDNSGGSRAAELHGLLKKEVMIRRLKAEVLTQLPPKRRQVVRLPRPPANRWPQGPTPARDGSASDEEDEDDGDEREEDEAAEGEEKNKSEGGTRMSASHRTALAKLQDVVEWLKMVLGAPSYSSSEDGGQKKRGWKMKAASGGSADEGSGDICLPGLNVAGSEAPKILVFAHHRDVMDRLYSELSGVSDAQSNSWRGVKVVRIDGSHDSQERLSVVQQFRSDPSVRVALLSITAAAVGLDFSSASIVVFAELPVEVSLVRQAEDRAHRQGQHNCVNVYFLVAKGTADDRRWQALNSSLNNITQVHDGPAALPATEPQVENQDMSIHESEAHPGTSAPSRPQSTMAGHTSKPSVAASSRFQHGLEVDTVFDMEPCTQLPTPYLPTALLEQPRPENIPQDPAAIAVTNIGLHENVGVDGPSAQDGLPTGLQGIGHEKLVGVDGPSAAALASIAIADIANKMDTTADAPAAQSLQHNSKLDNADGIQTVCAAHEMGARLLHCKTDGEDREHICLLSSQETSYEQNDMCDPTRSDMRVDRRQGEVSEGIVSDGGITNKMHEPEEVIDLLSQPSQHEGGQGAELQEQSMAKHAREPCEVVTGGDSDDRELKRNVMDELILVPNKDEMAGNTLKVQETYQGGEGVDMRAVMERTVLQEGSRVSHRDGSLAQVLQEPTVTAAMEGANAAVQKPEEETTDTPGQNEEQPAHQLMDLVANASKDAKADVSMERETAALTHDTSAQAQAMATNQEDAFDVWFEVSAHTGRCHLHLAPDGSKPAGLSMPLDLLLLQDTRTIDSICSKVQEIATSGPAREGQDYSFVGPCGAVTLPASVTDCQLRYMLDEARGFARDWAELRSITKNRLYGKVIGSNLQEEVDNVMAAAAAAGALGLGKDRYIQPGALKALPAGWRWQPVKVKMPMTANLRTHQQPFDEEGRRMCILCQKLVADCRLPAAAILEGCMHLFCSPECERLFFIRSHSSSIRRALFKAERGVCQMCKLDCHALVQHLQSVRRGSGDWLPKRTTIVERLAPRFTQKAYRGLLERLLNQATEGNAWNADHIIAVYQGGGQCDLDNMRTLCVACHQDVTKAQARERAAERKKLALNIKDIRNFFSSTAPGTSGQQRGHKRKKCAKRDYCVIDPDSDHTPGDITASKKHKIDGKLRHPHIAGIPSMHDTLDILDASAARPKHAEHVKLKKTVVDVSGEEGKRGKAVKGKHAAGAAALAALAMARAQATPKAARPEQDENKRRREDRGGEVDTEKLSRDANAVHDDSLLPASRQLDGNNAGLGHCVSIDDERLDQLDNTAGPNAPPRKMQKTLDNRNPAVAAGQHSRMPGMLPGPAGDWEEGRVSADDVLVVDLTGGTPVKSLGSNRSGLDSGAIAGQLDQILANLGEKQETIDGREQCSREQSADCTRQGQPTQQAAEQAQCVAAVSDAGGVDGVLEVVTGECPQQGASHQPMPSSIVTSNADLLIGPAAKGGHAMEDIVVGEGGVRQLPNSAEVEVMDTGSLQAEPVVEGAGVKAGQTPNALECAAVAARAETEQAGEGGAGPVAVRDEKGAGVVTARDENGAGAVTGRDENEAGAVTVTGEFGNEGKYNCCRALEVIELLSLGEESAQDHERLEQRIMAGIESTDATGIEVKQRSYPQGDVQKDVEEVKQESLPVNTSPGIREGASDGQQGTQLEGPLPMPGVTGAATVHGAAVDACAMEGTLHPAASIGEAVNVGREGKVGLQSTQLSKLGQDEMGSLDNLVQRPAGKASLVCAEDGDDMRPSRPSMAEEHPEGEKGNQRKKRVSRVTSGQERKKSRLGANDIKDVKTSPCSQVSTPAAKGKQDSKIGSADRRVLFAQFAFLPRHSLSPGAPSKRHSHHQGDAVAGQQNTHTTEARLGSKPSIGASGIAEKGKGANTAGNSQPSKTTNTGGAAGPKQGENMAAACQRSKTSDAVGTAEANEGTEKAGNCHQNEVLDSGCAAELRQGTHTAGTCHQSKVLDAADAGDKTKHLNRKRSRALDAAGKQGKDRTPRHCGQQAGLAVEGGVVRGDAGVVAQGADLKEEGADLKEEVAAGLLSSKSDRGGADGSKSAPDNGVQHSACGPAELVAPPFHEPALSHAPASDGNAKLACGSVQHQAYPYATRANGVLQQVEGNGTGVRHSMRKGAAKTRLSTGRHVKPRKK